MTTFREPTNEMPYWLNISVDRARLWVNRRDGVGQIREQSFFLKDAEALLEVLLDICPNAHAIAGSRLNSTLCNVAHWIERGCDPLQAAKELRLLSGGKTP